MGADQSQPEISKDEEYVPIQIIEEEKKFLQAIEKAAKDANYILVKNTNIGAMMSAWLDESVEDIIVHTHGAAAGGGIEISHLWKGGVLNRRLIERDIPVDEVFEPAKGKGKCLSVVCCYPWSNVKAKSDIYSKAGVKFNYFFEDIIKDASQDGLVKRQVSYYKILQYLQSKKKNQ